MGKRCVIIYQVHKIEVPLAAATSIAGIRHEFEEMLEIPEDADVFLNGNAMGESTLVTNDDTVEFVYAGGE